MEAEPIHLGDVKSFLSARGVSFTVEESLTFDEQTCLRVAESGVGVIFVRGALHSVQLSADALLRW